MPHTMPEGTSSSLDPSFNIITLIVPDAFLVPNMHLLPSHICRACPSKLAVVLALFINASTYINPH